MRFSQYLAPSNSRFSNSCISAKYCLIITNHKPMEILFIQMMYKSQFQIIDPYDWFCGLGSLVRVKNTNTIEFDT